MMQNGELLPLSAEEQDQYERDKISGANAAAGELSCAHCQECNDKGYIFERCGTELVSVECRCMKKRRSIWRMEKSGLKDLLREYTFDSYQTPDEIYREAKRKAMAYVKDCAGKWFVASGNPGSGKTHICTAICGELLNSGLSVRYMLWRDSSTQIKAVVNDEEEYARLITPLKTVKVLYIDDFFKTAKLTTGDMNLAFELLNARYNRKDLVTIISTELHIGKLLQIDEAIGSRIYERSKDYYLRFEGKDKNWRLRK